jgi:hypothetical protein
MAKYPGTFLPREAICLSPGRREADGEGGQAPCLSPSGCGGDGSFLRKQEPSLPLPLWERPAEAKPTPGEGVQSVIPAKAGIQEKNWIPTFVGMT